MEASPLFPCTVRFSSLLETLGKVWSVPLTSFFVSFAFLDVFPLQAIQSALQT